MIKYQRNNILFRIASATAIAKFKNDQANSFLQLIRKELYFDNSAKEVVLVEYDRFSQWIFRIERIFLSHGESYLPDKLQEAIVASCMDEIYIIEKVIETNPVVFKSEVLDYIKLVHSYAKPVLKQQFSKCLYRSRCGNAFEQMLEYLSKYLQHVLLSMYELNNNLFAKTKDPFVCVTNFCVSNTSNHNNELTPTLMRLNYFKSQGELTDKQFEVKNFTTDTEDEFLKSIFDFHAENISMEVREGK